MTASKANESPNFLTASRLAAVLGHMHRSKWTGQYLTGWSNGREDCVRRGMIERHQDAVERPEPDQRLDVDIVRLGRQRIGEEDQHIEPPLGDHGPELRVAAERTRLEAGHGKPGSGGHPRPRGAGAP